MDPITYSLYEPSKDAQEAVDGKREA